MAKEKKEKGEEKEEEERGQDEGSGEGKGRKGKREETPRKPPAAPTDWDDYKLVPKNPVMGPEGWIVKVDFYYSPPKIQFFGVPAEVEVLDRGGLYPIKIGRFGRELILPPRRYSRRVQISARRAWIPLQDGGWRIVNPDCDDAFVNLPGQPYEVLKKRVGFRPDRNFMANLIAVFTKGWKERNPA